MKKCQGCVCPYFTEHDFRSSFSVCTLFGRATKTDKYKNLDCSLDEYIKDLQALSRKLFIDEM